MKKLICIFLVCVTLCSLVACNNEKETVLSNDSGIENVIDYSAAIHSINEAMKYIRYCVDLQQNHFSTYSDFEYLYSSKDAFYESVYEKGGNYNTYVEKGYSCYIYRGSAQEKLENAKSNIKGGSGDLHTAVQKYYLAVAECMDFTSNYPGGHTELTWNNKWTELEQKVSSAANEVDLYK